MNNENNDSINFAPILQPLLQDFFYSLFPDRNKTLVTHWDMYIKSGLLLWFRRNLRKKYGFVGLKYVSDFSIYNDHDDIYGFGSDWLVEHDVEDAFRREVLHIMELLYLPANAYYRLFVYFLYGKLVDGYPFYNFADVIAGAKYNDMPNFEYLGYTEKDIKAVEGIYKLYLQSIFLFGNRDPSGEILQEKDIEVLKKDFEHTLKNLQRYKVTVPRKVQNLKNVELNIKILKHLKDYGCVEEHYDYAIGSLIISRVTSKVLAERIYSKLDMEEKILIKSSERVRKQIQRLLIKYPFLKNYTPAKAPYNK